MGCTPSSTKDGENRASSTSSSPCAGTSQSSSASKLSISIVDPKTSTIVELRYTNSNDSSGKASKGPGTQEEFLMNIMNSVFFAEEKNAHIDVCFQSLYNKQTDRYHYYLYRLLNVEVENIEQPYKAKMWVLYINNKPIDWDTVVNSNLKHDLTKQSKLTWKFERFSPTMATSSVSSSQTASSTPNQFQQSSLVRHQLSQPENLDYLRLQPASKYNKEEEEKQLQRDSIVQTKGNLKIERQSAGIPSSQTTVRTSLVNNTTQLQSQQMQERLLHFSEEKKQNRVLHTEEEQQYANHALPTEAAIPTEHITADQTEFKTNVLDTLPSEDTHILDHYLINKPQTKNSKSSYEGGGASAGR